MNIKADIMGAIAALKKTEKVPIPNSDKCLTIEEINTSGVIAISNFWTDNAMKVTERQALIVVLGCPEFADTDLEEIQQWPRDFLKDVSEKILKLSGAGDEPTDENGETEEKKG